MKIAELKPGAGIEIKATITSIQPIRKLWYCFECKKANKELFKGVWKTEEEFKEECPNCGAKQTEEKGKGLWIQRATSALIKDDSGMTYLDIWNEDIGKFQIGNRIHIINGYAKAMDSGGVNVSKGKFGSILKIEE